MGAGEIGGKTTREPGAGWEKAREQGAEEVI